MTGPWYEGTVVQLAGMQEAGKKLTGMGSSVIFYLAKKWEKFSGMKNESKLEVAL